MSFFKKFWPVFFFLLITIFYSFPYLFQGKIPFPSSYIANNLAPWNKYLPAGPIKNGIPDVPGEIFPLRSLVIDLWKSGTVPLWNPFAFSGSPLLANFQSAAFFPGNLLFLIFSKVDGWSLLVLLQPLLAGLFIYLFLQQLKLSKIASVFSGISFMFCGYLTVWGSYTTMGYTVLFLPLALFWLEKYFATGKRIFLPLITLTLAISFFAGHIQTWTYVFGATLLYTVMKFFIGKYNNYNHYNNYKILLLLLFFIFLTIPLVALQLFPTWEFYGLSGRSLVRNNGNAVGIPLNYLITFLAPDFFGNPVTRNDWFGTYAEWMGFIGLVPLIFSFLALTYFKKDKRIWPIIIIGIAGLFLSVKTPVLTLISSLPLPVLRNSNPSRAISLLSFSLASLSGFGLEQVIINWEKAKKKLLLILTGLSIIFIIIITFIFLGKTLFSPETVISLRTVSLRNLVIPFGILFALWGIFVLTWAKPSRRKVAVFCILLIAALEMCRFYTKWTPYDNRSEFYKATAVTDFLSSQKNSQRYYGQFNQAASNNSYIYGTDGYEPLNLLSYSQLITAAGSGKINNDYLLEVKLQSQEKYTGRILSLLGVKYLVYGANDIRNPFVYPFWKYGMKNYPQLFNDKKYAIFNNKNFVKRPSLFYQYQVEDNKEKALSKLLSDTFDYNNELILGSEPGLKAKPGTGSAVLKQYSADRIEMQISSDNPGLVFLSDNYYPGWQAYVNGKKTKILLADFTFRAVAVPAGNSVVVMSYEPDSFKYGAIISGITLVFLLIFLSLSFPRKRESIR